ncbi:hypothetical protein As57867_004446, partial [Aphanomyces stellatus]
MEPIVVASTNHDNALEDNLNDHDTLLNKSNGTSSENSILPTKSSAPGKPTPPQHSIAYRADIDGLRTVAVVPVLLFHAYPAAFPGGFVGVDIFFVISGYLISSILFREMALHKFTYANFYIRRVRRIFPTLVLVLAATSYLGCLYLLVPKLKALAATMLAGTLFGANLQLVSLERGYWDDDMKENPLLHLWSLGVEEQFYFLWPCLSAVLVKLAPR